MRALCRSSRCRSRRQTESLSCRTYQAVESRPTERRPGTARTSRRADEDQPTPAVAAAAAAVDEDDDGDDDGGCDCDRSMTQRPRLDDERDATSRPEVDSAAATESAQAQ